MSTISGLSQITSVDLYAAETVASHMVGTMIWDGDSGKAFRYALNGAVALVKGNLLQDAVADTQFIGLAIGTAGVIGDNFLQVTNGTTTVVPTQYIGGTINVYTAGAAVALGDEYTIVGVTGTLTTGGALKVYLDRPLRYAYATTTTAVNMKPSPWAGVIQAPITTQTGIAVGVAIYEIPASTATVFQYGWVQTHGICNMLSSNQTFAIGSEIGTPCLDAAGAAGVYIAGTTHQKVGVVRQAQSSTHGITAFLQID